MTLLLTNDDVERTRTMRDSIDVRECAYPELGERGGVNIFEIAAIRLLLRRSEAVKQP